jgi:Chromo (CHRromatin Organisation MOdifier) domain/Zinc knuckle
MASTSSTSANVKAPQLASANGTASGMPHALWRPQMQTFLMQHSIEERDYACEMAKWRELDAAVQLAAKAAEDEAIAFMLGESQVVEQESDNKDASAQKKAKQRVADLIGRSRRAFGYLYSALPVDLRPLVADVPQGYAYGIWSFLEKKFRNTEQDSVMALWERITTVTQETDETYDVYKARVDSVVELLTNAKQTLPAGLYASLLLWRLQPRYATAVLTLKTGDKLKDPATIDWSSITEYMSQYERSQLSLGETESAGSSDRAMAARGKSSAGGADRRDHSNIQCFNCRKLGHFANRCPLPDRRQNNGDSKLHEQRGKGRRPSRSPSLDASSSNSEEGANTNAKEAQHANAVRGNSFAALTDQDNDDRNPRNGVSRMYLARVMTGLKLSARPVESQKRRKDEPAPTTVTVKEKKSIAFGPKTEAKSRESDRRSPPQAPKSLDAALRTTAKAVDSGATVSITGTIETLINVRRCIPMPILMADKTVVSAVYKGDMPMRLPVAGKPATCISITIREVYYHERIDANLLSWGCMRLDGWEMHSDKDGTFLITPKGTRINASTRGRLTILDDAGPERTYASRLGRFVCQSADDVVLLHQRVGHASWGRLVKMCHAKVTDGIGDISGLSAAELKKAETSIKQCEACATGKQHRNALGHRGLDKGTEAGEVMHMDTFYVSMRDSHTGKKYNEYCLLGTDGFTELRQAARTITLRDLQTEVINMIRKSTTATGRRPRLIVSDLGSEFDNRVVKEYCRKRGIHLQPTPARAKELNGIAEKSVDTVKNHVRAMLYASGMPEQRGWARAVAHHVYLWNRTHIGALTGKTPFEAMCGREPSIINVGVFGCDAFVHQDRSQRDTTFSPKAEPGIYLGHDFEQNCAVVHMLHTGKAQRVKDVLFREGSFKHLNADLDGEARKIGVVDIEDFGPVDDDDSSQSKITFERAESKDHNGGDGDGDADDEVDTPPQFEVKSIAGERTIDGKKEYSVKWVGYPAPTWEPADTILADAPDAVKEYESFLSQRSSARVTRSSSRSTSTLTAPSTSTAGHESDDDEDSESSAIMAARYAAAKCL